MPYRPQPMEGAFFPPAYPSHDYTGEGEIVTVRVGDEVVGFLSRKDWTAVGWLPRPNLSEEADTVRQIVNDLLREGARDGAPMVNAWASVLDATQHDAPVTARLDGLRGD